MSESLQARWVEGNADLGVHRALIEEGILAIENELVLPGDSRFQIAYSNMVAGEGRYSSWLAIGDPATGKTAFGNLIMGDNRRLDIVSETTEDKMYGHTNPINANEIVSGMLDTLESDDRALFLNEISQLANTGILQRLWDGETCIVNGQEVTLTDFVAYLTSNFPDGGPRVKKMDDALLSRMAGRIITGDHDDATAALIQGHIQGARNGSPAGPLLPPADTRRALSERVKTRYPETSVGNKAVGGYVVSLINALNATGMVEPISKTDARTGQALRNVARTNMFMRGERPDTAISSKHVAEVAALVLPTVVKLSRTGRERLNAEAGEVGRERSTPMERAVAVNLLVGNTAMRVYGEGQNKQPDVYANTGFTNLDFERALSGDNSASVNGDHQDQGGNNGVTGIRRRIATLRRS